MLGTRSRRTRSARFASFVSVPHHLARSHLPRSAVISPAIRSPPRGSTCPTMMASARDQAGCQFAEVEVDTETGVVRVAQVVAVHDAGRIVDPLTARSQVNGGVIMGVGFALLEERRLDPQTRAYGQSDDGRLQVARPARRSRDRLRSSSRSPTALPIQASLDSARPLMSRPLRQSRALCTTRSACRSALCQ